MFSLAQLFEIMKESSNEITMEDSLNRWLERFDVFLIQTVMETVDKELYAYYYQKGWRVDRKEKRTIQFEFGSVTYTRRRLRKEGEKSFIPLDRMLNIQKWARQSQNVKKKIAEAGMDNSFRKAARNLQRLSRIQVSHTKVHSITQEVGKKIQDFLKHRPSERKENQKKKTLPFVFIEGDGLYVGGRDGEKPMIHRVLIHEGVKAKGKRSTLKNAKHFSSVQSSKVAFEKAGRYLHEHYDLRETIVLSNSDGGAGYQKVNFNDMIGRVKRHEHFRDRFHVNEKIKARLSFDKPMQEKVRQAIRVYDWEKVECALETAESRLIDLPESVVREREEQIERLKAYLKRNWSSIQPIQKRDLPKQKGLGVCESSHRTYSYRMKKQGRSWSKSGAGNMVALLTVEKNNEWIKALTTTIDENVEQLGKHIKYASRNALRKINTDDRRIQTGRIANYGAASSFVGQMVKSFG